MSCGLLRPPHLGFMQIYGWEFLVVCHHNDNFGDHRHCESGSRPRDQRVEYLHGWESVKVTHHPARFGSHKHCGNGVLKKFVSLTMVTMKMGNKQTITVIIATVAIRNNTSSKTQIFYIWTTTDKTELTGKEQGNKKCCNLKKIHFQ